ncbi:hypothetical protein GIB67_037452 [Kingdonia uniflora]|uniref:Uncharacterized protein n=1 Tax=Kingdonia uniflora TaxID=39325 RepID=A0A7J7NI76_9MAGN|nr:hypothetical protein GIB67_037452 [Kingdonia uniflora]
MVRTRSQGIRHAAEDRLAIKIAKVRERIFGSLGYDAELPMRACQLEGLDSRSRELEYARYFYESFFRIFMRDSAERERYKAPDTKSGKDTSVLESRTVHPRNNKCQPHERERINSSSSSPSNRFIIKNLESTQRERQKIKGINQELSEGDKRLKREKGLRSRWWEYSSVVRGKLDSTADSHPDTEDVWVAVDEASTSGRTNKSDSRGDGGLEQFLGFPGQLVSYPPCSDAFKEFCKAKGAIEGKWDRTWNDNIIWVKGNCLQRDDEEFLDFRFRSVKQSVKSTVERKESLLDEVAEEETEPKLVLGELGLREKFVEGQSTSIDDLKEVEERARLAILQGKEDTSKIVAPLVKGIWLSIEEQESGLKKAKSELEKNLARANMKALKEVRQLKAAHTMAIGQL